MNIEDLARVSCEEVYTEEPTLEDIENENG